MKNKSKQIIILDIIPNQFHEDIKCEMEKNVNADRKIKSANLNHSLPLNKLPMTLLVKNISAAKTNVCVITVVHAAPMA